jgi:hypothetical protein
MFIYYPLLLSVYPVLILFAENHREVSYSELMIPSSIALSFSFFIWLILYYLTAKKIHLSALLTAILLIPLFFYGHIFEFLERKDMYIPQFRHLQFVPLVLFLCACSGYFISGIKEAQLRNVSRVLNFVFLVLVVYNAAVVIYSKDFSVRSLSMVNSGSESSETINSRLESISDFSTYVVAQPDTPDVYYIVLDEFASFNTMESEYDYDNQLLKSYLAEKGFLITPRSRSNYICTWKSLDTVLNMKHASSDHEPLDHYNRILDSKVSRYFREMGYAYIYNSDQKLYNGTYENPYADIDFVSLKKGLKNSSIGISNFSDMLLRTTVLRPYYLHLSSLKYGHRQNELMKIEAFDLVLQKGSPKYVFSHHLISHEPFVFTEDGGYVPYNSQYDWSDKRRYLDVYKYQSKVLIQMLEDIFNASESPPVIIVQSDHGIRKGVFGPKGDKSRKMRMKEEVENALWAKEIMSTFYFPPGMSVPELAEDLEPVNTFKTVLDVLSGRYEPLTSN